MVSEGIFINGEKVTFNPENILTGDISTYTEQIGEATQDWLDEHLEPGGSVPIDDTLTISGAAADAKKTGDEIAELNDGLTDVGAVLHYKNPTIIDGKTVTTTGTTADPTSFNTESGWSCAVDDCKPGVVYTISGHGGAKTRLWCFIDKDNNILAVADIGKTVDDLRLVVPPKAVKIICNFQPSAHTVKLTKIMGVFYTDYELKNRNAAADALRVGEEVGLINDRLSQLRTNEVIRKVDALLGARWSLNHISTDNGQDKDNGYNCRTDNYISVADADGYLHYKMSSPAGIRLFLFFYNSAKEWISHDAGSLHTGTYEGQVALPAGTAYIRFLLSNEDWGKFDTISDATDYFDAWFVPESGEEKKFETIYGARIEEAAQSYEADAAAARLGYIWISDLHFKKNWTDNTTALKRQLKAVARLANRASIDFVCIGGDIIDAESEADDLLENINDWLSPLAECNKPVIYLIGNHDDNAYGEWIGKLPAKGLFVDRGEYHNDICAPTSDAGYFYFDIDRKGVRVVCLDTIDYESRSGKNGSNWWSLSQSQVEWFCQKALDTPYDIVILSHMTPDYDYNSWHLGNEGGYHSDLISAIAAYNARGTMTLYSKTFDFTEAEGYIKMMHVGHAHFEFEAAKTVGGIPCIFTSCAKQYGQAQQSYETAVTGKDDTYTIASSVAYDTHHQNTTGYEYKRYTTRTLDTISEALFDLVSVKNTRADFYRIGAGEDRQVTLQATNPRKYDDQIAKTREEVDDLKSGISDLKEDLTALAPKEDMLKSFPTDTASGSVASFADGANVPVKSLIVNIDPVQSGSGDPSPTNVRPISGWSEVNVGKCGKNTADVKYGNTVPSITNGEMVSANGWCTDFINVDNSKNYMFSFVSTAPTYVFYYDENHNYLGNQRVLMNTDISTSSYFADARYVKLRNDAVAGNDPHMQLEVGSTATAYEPYSGQSIIIPLGQTVYGGTLDVLSGVLTVDRARVDMGTLPWNKSGSNTDVFFCNASDWKSVVASRDIICPIYTTYTGSTASSAIDAVADKSIMVNKRTANYPDSTTGNYAEGSLLVKDSAYSDTATFKAAMNGIYLVYPLATPTTVQLTPHEVRTLLGSNNVWADTGDSTVTYRADPTLYISRLTEHDADMVADANIVSGQYFMVGNSLFKATANIASGETISPNVNCTRKSLSEALNELNA